jgi:hypothetical protein
MAKKLIPFAEYEFDATSSSIIIKGNIQLEKLLLITNVTANKTIYQFNNPSLSVFSIIYDAESNQTTISLAYDTATDATMSSSDHLQIFIESASQSFEPTKSLLDAVGKLRISQPENLIDTDFEYGLQSSKWETIQSVNNIPSVYSYSGDLPVEGITGVEALTGSKQIKVTTNIPHGLALGDPISVQGVTQYQAEGYFIISGTPDALTFFFELDVAATESGDISGSYTTIIPAKFYQGSALLLDTQRGAQTDAQDPSVITVSTNETNGFAENTKVYIRNTVGPKDLIVTDPTATATDLRPTIDTDSFFSNDITSDLLTNTGRGSYKVPRVITYDWAPTYHKYLTAADWATDTNRITWTAHGLHDRACLLFSTPKREDVDGGLTDGTVYYARVVDEDTIELSSNYENLSDTVVLDTLANDYGASRLGLVYKIEASSGTTRNTSILARSVASRTSSVSTGYVNTSGQYRTDQIGTLSQVGGNINNIQSVVIYQVYGTGDLNRGNEYVNFYTSGQNFKGGGTGLQYHGRYYSSWTYPNWDVTRGIYQSGSNYRLYYYISESGATSYHYATYYFRTTYTSIQPGLQYSGMDLQDTEWGLGGGPGDSVVAFQGRTPGSYSSSADAFSYLTQQRTNGRYTNTRIQYPGTTVTSGGNDGSFVTTYNDSGTTNYGTSSEIFYTFAQTLGSEANTFFLQDHGIKEGDTVVVDIDTTDFVAGQRFAFSDSIGNRVELSQQSNQFTASVLNKDLIRLTVDEQPGTDDVLEYPQNVTLSVRTSNELYNTIFVPNHKIIGLTNATYKSPGAWPQGPYYVYGSSGGSTGYFYPLFTTQAAAEAADASASAHVHTFDEFPGTTFYMPNDDMNHAAASAPTDVVKWIGHDNVYSVTLDGTDWLINGEGLVTNSVEPTLTLYRGSTYYFDANSAEPFYIKTAISSGTADQQGVGVTNQGTTTGVLAFAVPQDAPSTLYYVGTDAAIYGEFEIKDETEVVGGLQNNKRYTLERVNDNRLRINDLVTASNTATSVVGAPNNNTVTYTIDIETALGITDPSTATLTKIEYRGDFGSERGRPEYVTITFADGDSFLIGATGGADTDQWLTENNFSSKDISGLLFDDAGNVSVNITVDPTSDVNQGRFLETGNYYELKFYFSGQAGGIVLDSTGTTGLQRFEVPSVVGSYDGIYTISEITAADQFKVSSTFQVPQRVYTFDAANDVDALEYSIDLGEEHNLKTGEIINYGNKGFADIIDADQVSETLYVIAITASTIALASSLISAQNNSRLTLTARSGEQEFRSSNIIKNVVGSGAGVTGLQGHNTVTGSGTKFLSNFKTFDNIYIEVDGFIQPFTVDKITTDTTLTVFETFPANFTDADYFYGTEINLRPDGFSLHLPFDGGVNITAGTSPGSKIVRQSRKYFRYQSGKGIQNSFAINFNPPRVVKEVIRADGITAEVKTQEIHNLAVGDPIVIQDSVVSVGDNTYNGRFNVSKVNDAFSFEYEMNSAPEQVKAEGYPKYLRETWNDSYIRAGMFDDQNGFFYEYDGTELYCVRRSSTLQLSGVVGVTRSSQIVTGTGTSFTTQLQIGDTVVLRGQSYQVVQVNSDNKMVVQPAYRGVTSKNVKLTKTVDTRIPQHQWNIDKCDGTGTHGYVIDTTKIQMAYADYSWYGAGKIRFGFKDQNGEVVYVHEFTHNNRLGESYFRSGNLPGRYEISNGPQANAAPTLFHFGTSIIMDGTFDDDKAYLFTGNSSPFAFTNGSSTSFSSKSGVTSSFEVITLDGRRVFVYAIPCAEADLANVTTGMLIRDSGNNALPEGTYVAQIKKAGADSVVYTSYPALSTQPSGIAYPDIAGASLIVTGETEAVDLTQPLPLVSIRLAPSVDSSLTGAVGEREIINRMQMALKEAGVTTNQDVEVFLILNALPNVLEFSKVNSPSLSEIIRHKSGDTLLGGTTVYSLKASAGSIAIALNDLIELGNSILGGDGIFPAGPDFLTLAVQPQETSEVDGATPFFVSGKLSWSESQA